MIGAAVSLQLALLAGAVDYTKDVQPLWEKYCVMCHSANATMGSLNLESYADLQKGGNNGPVVFPKDPEGSLLYRSITGKAPEVGRMPMNNTVMADAEIKVIHDWIAEGALAQAPQKATAAGAEKPSRIYSLALSPDGKTVATGHYQKVVLSDGRSLNSRSLDGHAGIVRGLRWSKDGRLLIAGGGTPGRSGEIKVWQADGQLQKTFTGHKDAIFAVAISPDGKTIASASYDKLIKLWDVATGQESKTLKDHTDAIYALDFSPDGRFLISGAADRTVKLWHVESGERLFTVSEPGDAVHAVAFAPDGQHFAAAGQDKSIRVWKLEGGAKPKSAAMTATMIAHEDAVLALSYTPDGKHLVSSSADRSLKVFRSADLKEAAVHPGQADWVYGLAVHADGKKIAAASLNGVLQWIPLEVAP